jgi:GDPmannose 4,6-dehydratase
MRRALIVGDLGQDGSLLWEQLREQGFGLAGLGRRGVRAHGVAVPEAASIADVGQLRALLTALRPDQVYYLAAHHSSSERSAESQAALWQQSWAVNAEGLGNVLEAVAGTCPEAGVFYASSSRVFGTSDRPWVDETTPLRPACAYGVTKAAGMLLADYYVRERGLRVASGILFNHESPLRGPSFVSRRVVDGLLALKRGRAATLELGTLEARVDWGYAPDYTRAMQALLDARHSGAFVIASGELHSVREMLSLAADVLDVDWEGRVVETSARLGRPSQPLCGDATRLRRCTGWAPSVDFAQMVGLLVEAALAREKDPSVPAPPGG